MLIYIYNIDEIRKALSNFNKLTSLSLNFSNNNISNIKEFGYTLSNLNKLTSLTLDFSLNII